MSFEKLEFPDLVVVRTSYGLKMPYKESQAVLQELRAMGEDATAETETLSTWLTKLQERPERFKASNLVETFEELRGNFQTAAKQLASTLNEARYRHVSDLTLDFLVSNGHTGNPDAYLDKAHGMDLVSQAYADANNPVFYIITPAGQPQALPYVVDARGRRAFGGVIADQRKRDSPLTRKFELQMAELEAFVVDVSKEEASKAPEEYRKGFWTFNNASIVLPLTIVDLELSMEAPAEERAPEEAVAEAPPVVLEPSEEVTPAPPGDTGADGFFYRNRQPQRRRWRRHKRAW